jgi:hypothetical protein
MNGQKNYLTGKALPGDQAIALMKKPGETFSEQRQCVTLFYLQKKSYQEISLETRFTMNAGEELHPEWKEKFEIDDREKVEEWQQQRRK